MMIIIDPVRVFRSLLCAPLHPGEQEEDVGDEGGEIGWLGVGRMSTISL